MKRNRFGSEQVGIRVRVRVSLVQHVLIEARRPSKYLKICDTIRSTANSVKSM